MNEHIELTLILNALQNQSHAKDVSIDPTIDWLLFYKLIMRHRVWHQVHNAFKNNKSLIPIAEALAKHCQRDVFHILSTAGETVRIAREFTKQAIQHCFVKGTVLNVHIYGGLNTRPCRDIDILVHQDTFSGAMDILLALGYQKKSPVYELNGFKKNWYMRHKHDIAFYHPQRKILVELHFRLSYLGLDFFPISAIALRPIHLLNVPVMVPDDDYHVLYLMIHGAIHAWIRLRWLQDIVLFMESNRCDLNRVHDLATQINCQHIVEQTLLLVNKLFAVNNPVLMKLIHKPTRRATRLARIACQFITADYEMTEGLKNVKLFFSYRIYLAQLAVGGQKLHAVFGDLFKLDELFFYVTFPDKLSFMYYFVYPLWVIKFIFKSLVPRVR